MKFKRYSLIQTSRVSYRQKIPENQKFFCQTAFFPKGMVWYGQDSPETFQQAADKKIAQKQYKHLTTKLGWISEIQRYNWPFLLYRTNERVYAWHKG